MKAAGLSDIRKELQLLSPQKLAETCLALAKYKKENKELLSYLLFDEATRPDFVQELKSEVDGYFNELSPSANLYYLKKSLRKILRFINRYCKYIAVKAVTAEMLIYFLTKLKKSGIPYRKSQQLENMYDQQLKKINTLINSLHEDLRADFISEIKDL